MRAILIALALVVAVGPGRAHDVYSSWRDYTGTLCCGGDPVTGDCEAVSYTMLPGGDALMFSNRYGRSVHVAKDKIMWTNVPGSPFEAHFCGRPRATIARTKPEPDNPDPFIYTYCAAIAPGGV